MQQFIWQKHGFGTRRGSPEAEITLKQIHSNQVWNAHRLKDREHEGDALVTDEVCKSIGIRTADCVPILLLDCRTRAVAAVHAGWRGSAGAIVTRTIEKMVSDFGTDPNDLYAAMGPCIRACCYKVSPEVAEQFAPLFPECEPAPGTPCVDLSEANRRQMQAAGVQPGRIYDSGLCTACESAQFFSYRREPENPGRMLASIVRLA